MRRAHWIFFVAVVAAGMSVLLLLRNAPRSGTPLREPDPEASAPGDPAVLEVVDAPAQLGADAQTTPLDLDEVSASPSSDEAIAVVPLPLTRLSGSVVVTDVHGVEHASASGFFMLRYGIRGTQVSTQVLVERGVWTLEVRSVPGLVLEPFDAYGFVLDGRKAFEFGRREEVHGTVLLARWPALVTLRARSAAAELDEFCVLTSAEVQGDTSTYPWSRWRPLRKSPWVFELPYPGSKSGFRSWRNGAELLDSPVLFVGAQGYAWQRIELDLDESERMVVLQPGGELRVRLGAGLSPGPSIWLRLRQEGAERTAPHCELELQHEAKLLGLPAGVFTVAAELGARVGGRELARAEVRIVAGATSEVLLSAGEDLRPVRIEGTLELSHGWRLDDFELVIRVDGAPDADGPATLTIPRKRTTVDFAGSPLRRWRAELVPGRYVAVLAAANYAEVFEVTPATRTVSLLVPPP